MYTFLAYSTLVEIVFNLIIPVTLIIWLLFGKKESIVFCAIRIATSLLYIWLVEIAGYWRIFGVYYKNFLTVSFIIVTILSLFGITKLPLMKKMKVIHIFKLAVLVVVSVVNIIFIFYCSTQYYDKEPVDLTFPFKNGSYMIIAGGNGDRSPLMNYHGGKHDPGQIYALDIEKLNFMGTTQNGLGKPNDLKDYPIFNEQLYSPCDGEVVYVVDKYDNQPIGIPEMGIGAGNIIIIKKSLNVYVMLGHLQRGSIKVKKGDKVNAGEAVARIGNPGETLAPHLHIQVGNVFMNSALPITFEGKSTSKNAIFEE